MRYSHIIAAYEAEAELYRASGKERAARNLEAAARKIKLLMRAFQR